MIQGLFSDQSGNYSVSDMVRLTDCREVISVPREYLDWNLACFVWRDRDGYPLTPIVVIRAMKYGSPFKEHIDRVRERASLDFPIIIDRDMDVKDGNHRLCKAFIEGLQWVNCVVITREEMDCIRL